MHASDMLCRFSLVGFQDKGLNAFEFAPKTTKRKPRRFLPSSLIRQVDLLQNKVGNYVYCV